MRGLWVLAAVSLVASAPVTVEAQFFFDTFDTYANGSPIAGQGGWETWDNNPAADTIVTNAQSFTPPHSLLVAGPADIVHQFAGVNSGVWYAKAMTYVPSTQVGEMWFILLNSYAPAGFQHWSVQVVMCVTGCVTAGTVPGSAANIGGSDGGGGGSVPLILDQWVEVRVEVDLTNNQYTAFYNGTPIDAVPQTWTVTGALQLQAFDLYSNGSNQSYMDNVWLDTTLPVELMGFTVN